MAQEEYWGSMRLLGDPETEEPETDAEEEDDDDEIPEEDDLQVLLERHYEALKKAGLALILLLLFISGARADSLTEAQIAAQLEQGVIPLAVGVGDELALNLLNAQIVNISYTANEPTSLQLLNCRSSKGYFDL